MHLSAGSYLLKKANYFATNSQAVRWIFRILALSLAAMHVWAAVTSQSMNADGIAYLDIGTAYFRGDWANAINPVWPPLYSWILGLAYFVFNPSMRWEFPLVHIVNFVIFAGALLSFEFMWRRLRRYALAQAEEGWITFPDWAWWLIGYGLFIWTSLVLIQIWAVTPDMLTAALLFLAAGLLVDIRAGMHGWKPFIFLGIVLGLGYLAKTFMFTMAMVFLALCLLSIRRSRSSTAKVLLAAGIFLLISLPFIGLISVKKGALTIGGAGTVTYLRHVQGIPYPHWQGDPANAVRPLHPSLIIHPSPPIYYFGEPIGGTYPISTDPSYWFEGIELPFNLNNQFARLLISGLYYLDLFANRLGAFTALIVSLFIMSAKRKLPLLEVMRKWILLVPAAAAFAIYGLVLVNGRYIGAFVLIFWADILANIYLPDSGNNRFWLKVSSAAAAVALLVYIGIFNLEGLTRLNPSIQPNASEETSTYTPGPVEVAQKLQQLGVQSGDKVAVIGYGFDAFWARLARVRIVAEMLDTNAGEFWSAGDAEQQAALRSFAGKGVKAVVAEYVPSNARTDGWVQVGESNYYIYIFEGQ